MKEKGERLALKFWPLTILSLSGPILWSLHFGLLYAGQHTVCAAIDAGSGFLSVFVVVTTILFGSGLTAIGMFAGRLLLLAGVVADNPLNEFLLYTTRFLIVLSLIGVLWAGASALFPFACAGLR
ncbi:hypothetical protein [Hyphococcus sp.]|uniref:hypothetical protein n=1 Tax=Hyphococcus sp. TaxID=2038636 RepID=UPI003CCBC913